MPFYAVRIGRTPGIYSTWDECRTQTVKYPKARYKKFTTHDDAEAFIGLGGADNPSTAGAQVVYTATREPLASSAATSKRQPALGSTVPRARLSTLASTSVPQPRSSNSNISSRLADDPSSSLDQASSTGSDRVRKIDKRIQLADGQITKLKAKLLTLEKEKYLAEKEREVALLKQNLETTAHPSSSRSDGGDRRNAAHPYNRGQNDKPRSTQMIDINEVKNLGMPTSATSARSATVYTDGSCRANGCNGARAGIGVFWGHGDARNVSERLPGRQTNNRAEIQAVVRAVEQAKASGYEEINIHTDSRFLITSMTDYIHNWLANGWTLMTGKPVVNREDFEDLLKASSGIMVNYTHVRAHQGLEGNERADQLANDGAAEPEV